MTPASAVSPDQQDPVVTVVVPSYESGRTVRDTVESLLAQTWRDLEVLVVDDGSRRDAVPEDLPATIACGWTGCRRTGATPG